MQQAAQRHVQGVQNVQRRVCYLGLPLSRVKLPAGQRAVTTRAGRNGPADQGDRDGRPRGGRPGPSRGPGGSLLTPRRSPWRPSNDDRDEDGDDGDRGSEHGRSHGSRVSRSPPPFRRLFNNGQEDNDAPRERRGRGAPAGRGRPHDRAADDDVGREDAVPERDSSRTRGGERAAAGPAARAAVGEQQDPFEYMHGRLTQQLAESVVVRKETWEKLLGHVCFPRQAVAALELMLADARAREAAGWDWATHGYGQTAFQLVQAAAEAGAPGVAEQLLARREDLHLKLNKELVPTLMRKVAAAAADGAAAGDEVHEHVEVVQRLYDQEAALRGANSPEAAYELSRVLRRAEDVGGVRSLHAQMLREDLALRDRLLEDIEKWLAKRGVRV